MPSNAHLSSKRFSPLLSMPLVAALCLIVARPASAGVAIDLSDFIKGPETNGMTMRSTDATLNMRLCVQTRLEYGDTGTTPGGNAYSTDADLYFKILSLETTGALTKDLKYNLVFIKGREGQAGRTSSTTDGSARLQNAFIDYKLSDTATIRFGKAKLPYSRSAATHYSKQMFVELASSVDGAKAQFGDYFQPQAALSGGFMGDTLGYGLFVADGWEAGANLNGKDDKDGKVYRSATLYGARLEYSPPGFVETGRSDAHLGKGRHLTFSATGAAQKNIEYSTFNGIASTGSEDRTLTVFDVSGHLSGFTGQAEYLASAIEYTGHGLAKKRPKGWYAQAAYYINNVNIEPAVKYEIYDQDALAPEKKETNRTLGVNWYLKGHSLKASFNWIHSVLEDNAVSGLTVSGAKARTRDRYQLEAQLFL